MEQPIEIRAVEEVSVDMGWICQSHSRSPRAKIVTDRFHVMKPLIKELNKIASQVGIKGFDKNRYLEKSGKFKFEQLEELNKLSVNTPKKSA